MKLLPNLNKLFPFEYVGGGYFRLKSIPKQSPAPILHGYEAVEYVYDAIKRNNNNDDLHVTI